MNYLQNIDESRGKGEQCSHSQNYRLFALATVCILREGEHLRYQNENKKGSTTFEVWNK